MEHLDSAESWLNNVAHSHSGSGSTRVNYKYDLERFCRFIGQSPEKRVEDYEQMDEAAFRRKTLMCIQGHECTYLCMQF